VTSGMRFHGKRWGACIALMLAAVALQALDTPSARAGTGGQGVGVEYPAGVTSIKICGSDQYPGSWVCTTPWGVPTSSTEPPYQSVWWVDGRTQPVSGANPPSQTPRWWWNGTIEILMWNNLGQAYQPVPCQVPQSQASNWYRCMALNPRLSTPVPPSPSPSPSPSPAPSPSPPPFGNLPSGNATPPPVSLVVRGSRRRLHNGQWLVLQGRVSGLSAPGLVIQLQALKTAPRRHWVLFGNAYVHPDGSFFYRWHFTQTFTRQRYTLRARLHDQLGYQGQTVISRRIHVIVTG
jgi:hypothetical protein